MTFGAHKLVHSEPFLDYFYEIWHLLSALGSDLRNFFIYRCTSAVSALNYCSILYFKSLSYLYEVVRTNFSADFLDFENFDRNFAKIVAPPSDGNENYIAHLKAQSLLKTTLKTASKSGNKRQHNAWSNYAPLERTVLRTRSVTKKTHFRTYSRRRLYDLPQNFARW